MPTPTSMTDLQGFTNAQLQDKLTRAMAGIHRDPQDRIAMQVITDVNHVINQREGATLRGSGADIANADAQMRPDVNVTDMNRIKGNLPMGAGLAAGIAGGAGIGAVLDTSPELLTLGESLARKTFPKISAGYDAWKSMSSDPGENLLKTMKSPSGEPTMSPSTDPRLNPLSPAPAQPPTPTPSPAPTPAAPNPMAGTPPNNPTPMQPQSPGSYNPTPGEDPSDALLRAIRETLTRRSGRP